MVVASELDEPVEIITSAVLRAVLILVFKIVDVAAAVNGLAQVVPDAPDDAMVMLKGSSNQLPDLPRIEPAFMSILSTFKKEEW